MLLISYLGGLWALFPVLVLVGVGWVGDLLGASERASEVAWMVIGVTGNLLIYACVDRIRSMGIDLLV